MEVKVKVLSKLKVKQYVNPNKILKGVFMFKYTHTYM